MELIAGLQYSFEATWDASGLPAAMSVYDVTGVSPVLVSGPTAMISIPGSYSYYGKFTPQAGKEYFILKAIYVDGSFAAFDPDHAQSTETIRADDPGVIAASPNAIIGYVQNNPVPYRKQNVVIVQGGRTNFIVRLVDQDTGNIYPLTGATALSTCFENTDGTELMLALGSGVSIIDAAAGKLQISLTSAQTALLRTGLANTLELAVTFTGDPLKIQIPEAYDVLQTVC